MGEVGVRYVMRSPLAEFDVLMNVAGLHQITVEVLEKEPKDYQLMHVTSKL